MQYCIVSEYFRDDLTADYIRQLDDPHEQKRVAKDIVDFSTQKWAPVREVSAHFYEKVCNEMKDNCLQFIACKACNLRKRQACKTFAHFFFGDTENKRSKHSLL